MGRFRDSKPPVGYVRATHGTAWPCVDPTVGSLVGFGKDAERALKVSHHAILLFDALRVPDVISQLLTSHGSAKRGQKAEDEAATLQQIRAGVRFLDPLVLQNRKTIGLSLGTVSPIHRRAGTDTIQDPALHNSLTLTYIEADLFILADDSTSELWRVESTVRPRAQGALSPRTNRTRPHDPRDILHV